MKKELESYFSSVGGRDVVTAEEQLNNGELIRNFLEQVRTVEQDAVTNGADKDCVYYDGLAILKTREVYKKPDLTKQESYGMVQLANWLISQGVNTPKLHTVFYADKHYVEVFDKVRGGQIYLSSADAVLKGAFGKDYDCTKTKNFTPEQRKILSEYIYNYNMQSQLRLLAMPDSAYDHLVSAITTLVDTAFLNIDVNSGNVLFDGKEFALIDIDYRRTMEIFIIRLEMLTNKKCTPQDVINKLNQNHKVFNLFEYQGMRTHNEELAECALFPFCTSRWFQNHLTPEQHKEFAFRDKLIIKRVVDALSRQNIPFNLKHGKCFDLLTETFDGDMSTYAEVVESQVNMQREIK